MRKLFESRRKVSAIGAPDAKIIFTKAPFLQYEQFLLDKNFRQYLETIMVSKKNTKDGRAIDANPKSKWDFCRFWQYRSRFSRLRQTIWLARNIFSLWQKWQMHSNIGQLQRRIGSKLYKKCKPWKLYRNI